MECLDLQLSGSLSFERPLGGPLFWLTHLSIGLSACLILQMIFREGAAAITCLLGRRLVGTEDQAVAIASMLVLFLLPALVWIAACVLGLYPWMNKGLPIASGLLVCAAVAYLFRRHFLLQPSGGEHLEVDAIRMVLCLAVVVGIHVLNRRLWAKQYFLLHVAATLFALTAALMGAACVLRGTSRPARVRAPATLTLTLAALAMVAPMVLFGLSNDVRHALFTQAFDVKTLIYLARKLPGAGAPVDAANLTAPQPLSVPAVQPEGMLPKLVERVLLITVDTLRADHLQIYGYQRDTGPRITRFADRATTFDRAWAEGPATHFAINAIFGASPGTVGLTDVLRAARVKQTAITTRRLNAAIEQGKLESWFDKVMMVERDDDMEIARVAAAEIDAGRFDGLLWIHLMAPHEPYLDRHPNRFGEREIDRYDGEIVESSHAMEQVLAALERKGLAASTAVIFSSDHGEEFGDHGGVRHGCDVFAEQVRIPLIIRLPGHERPARIPVNVSQQDLPVTVAELLGVSMASRRGRSLVPLLTGGSFDLDRPVEVPPFGTFRFGAVTWENWKLNYSGFNGSFALYDLTSDPGERHNRYETLPAVVERLRQRWQRPSRRGQLPVAERELTGEPATDTAARPSLRASILR
jgi:glucan phosphoethanolaminetransferase (alkaline phosphatase superfamily)